MCLLASNAEALSPLSQEIHHEHLKSVLEMTGLAPLHRHRRQAVEVDSETLKTCAQVSLQAQCTSGLLQGIIDEAIRCGIMPTSTELSCRQNEARKYCGIIRTYGAYFPDLERISSICNSTNECSSECRGNITMLRASLGCCINHILNTSVPLPQYATLFSYSLWSTCGVETPPATCPPSQLDLTTTRQTRICSRNDFYHAQYISTCTRSNIQPLINALRDSQRCAVLVQSPTQLCGVYNGQPCLYRSGSPNLQTATTSCTSTTTCSSTCRSSLSALRNELDCCFNNLYNATIAQGQAGIADNGLWMECGLETLGRCPIQLLDGPSTTQSGTVSLHTTQSGTASLHTTQSGTVSLHTTQSGTASLHTTQNATVSLHTTQSDAMSLHAMHSGMLMAILGMLHVI